MKLKIYNISKGWFLEEWHYNLLSDQRFNVDKDEFNYIYIYNR